MAVYRPPRRKHASEAMQAVEPPMLHHIFKPLNMLKFQYIQGFFSYFQHCFSSENIKNHQKLSIYMLYHLLYQIIASNRQTGGSLRAISPCYRPASKGAGFLFVQALLSLPLLLAPSKGYVTLRRDLHTPSHLIYPLLCHTFLVLLYIFLRLLH